MFTARTLAEGKWAILVAALLALGTALWCPARWALAVPVLLLVFVLSFFRDPERPIGPDPREFVSPADGKVVQVERVSNAPYLGGEAQMVAIFLSVFNVHVQRAPVTGTIKFVKYQPGKFLDARDPQCAIENEARVVGLEAADGSRCAVRQVAGLIARRIVGWSGEGASVAKGERIGMIRFGSRVELYVPLDVEVVAKVGETVHGGTSILARKRS
jgi:phosphatidylserine decarboxylase